MGLTPLEGLVGGTRSGDLDPTLVFHHTKDCASNALQEEEGDRFISKAEMALNKCVVVRLPSASALGLLAPVWTHTPRGHSSRESGLKALAGTADFGVITRRMERSVNCTDDEAERAQLAYDGPSLTLFCSRRPLARTRAWPNSRTRSHPSTLTAVYLDRLLKFISFYLFKLLNQQAAGLGPRPHLVFSGGIGERSSRLRKDVVASLGFLGLDLDGAANEAEEGGPVRRIGGGDKGIEAVWVIETDEELQCAKMAVRPFTFLFSPVHLARPAVLPQQGTDAWLHWPPPNSPHLVFTCSVPTSISDPSPTAAPRSLTGHPIPCSTVSALSSATPRAR
jgi:acetate kinase